MLLKKITYRSIADYARIQTAYLFLGLICFIFSKERLIEMVYVFLAQGFEEVEALAPVDVLRRCGVDVRTVGVGEKTVVSSHNVSITADLTTDEISKDNLEAVILPGGMPGTLNLEKSPAVQEYIDFAAENDLYVCAICAAPSILGHKNLLSGRKATCYPGFEKDLYGAEYTGEGAVADGKFITGKGAGAAVDFGLLIAAKLCGEEISASVRKSMQCPC